MRWDARCVGNKKERIRTKEKRVTRKGRKTDVATQTHTQTEIKLSSRAFFYFFVKSALYPTRNLHTIITQHHKTVPILA